MAGLVEIRQNSVWRGLDSWCGRCHGWAAGVLVVEERPGLNVTDLSDWTAGARTQQGGGVRTGVLD